MRSGEAEWASAPPKFSVDVPFFADEQFNVLFLKEVTKNVHENQQAKPRADNIKFNTLKEVPSLFSSGYF